MASRGLIVGILLGILAILGTAVLLFIAYLHVERQKVEQRLVHLLCYTDHQALLEACREVSKRAGTGELRAGRAYAIRRHMGRYGFPQAILNVDPLFVRIDSDGSVWVELFWAPSQGVVAYPEGYQAYGERRPGDKELVPGLWFYDEEYSLRRPKYVEYIDGLIARGKKNSPTSEIGNWGGGTGGQPSINMK